MECLPALIVPNGPETGMILTQHVIVVFIHNQFLGQIKSRTRQIAKKFGLVPWLARFPSNNPNGHQA